ncbi:MAG: YtxH domain-containing protein [Oscillospiraceae bacterium]|nr:YtxH domain-containing protein [Oscillospiraceae bacterium]
MIIGAVVGGAVGFLYYKKLGCRLEKGYIVKNPYFATIFGILVGLWIGSM